MFLIIDGLDVAGKETLAKLVVDELRYMGKVVETVAFPRYETDLGECIKEELRKPEGDRDLPALIGMFCRDRIDYLGEIGKDVEGKIYVFDRYSACNILYNYHMRINPYVASALNSDTSYAQLRALAYAHGKSIMNVYIGQTDSLSVDKHRMYIDAKVGKVSNEALDKQIMFNDNMCRAIHDCRIPTPDKFLSVGFDMCNAVHYMCEDVVSGLDNGKYLVSESTIVNSIEMPRGVPKSYTGQGSDMLGMWFDRGVERLVELDSRPRSTGSNRVTMDTSARNAVEKTVPKILEGMSNILVNGRK